MRCPLCGGDMQSYKGSLVRCFDCGLFENLIRPTKEKLIQEERKGLLRACTDMSKREERLKKAGYQLDLIQKYSDIGIVYDVGCAAGFFMYAAKQRGWEVYGNEISEASIKWAKNNYNIDIDFGFLEDLWKEGKLPTNYYNAIVLWNTLEHTFDPAETLRICDEMLSPNGIILIEVPDKREGYITRWYEKRHLWEFNRGNILPFMYDLGYVCMENIIYPIEKDSYNNLNLLFVKR